ncbi:AraC family transcriptional regulator [Paenibacillus sp. FSL W8-0439]|uniref:AraC family transcriptional regulator n=1 Tax=Paenibacillus sp. FSL W8-0439 TaxID=2921716 RepID=UPI0030FB8007
MSKNIPIFHDFEFMNPRKFDLSPINGPFYKTKVKDVLSPHRHDFYEIFWILEGTGTVHIDFKEYTLQSQMLCFISPGQVHGWSFTREDQPLRGYLLKFNNELLTEYGLSFNASDEGYTASLQPIYHINNEQKEFFNGIFELLYRECRIALPRGDEAVRSYLRLLSIEIYRIQNQMEMTHQEERTFQLTQAFLNLVEDHYKERLNIDNYAQMLFVTPNHLIQTIKGALGKTAGEIIRNRRILEGKRLLRFSTLSVEDIATLIGFVDPSYFSRAFKQHTGLSPTRYRILH